MIVKIGFVGLGVMGRSMAGHLAKAGHKLFANPHGKPLPGELAAAGAERIDLLKDLASKSDIVINMMPDKPHVEAVLFSSNGIASGLSEGKIVVDMSSISPIDTWEFAARIERLGSDYVDAPVSGGEIGARNAKLTIMSGTKKQVFGQVKPLLEMMCKNITLVGQVGAGLVAKIANQIIVGLNIQAVFEALLFASRAGAEPAHVREALMGGFASSRILEVHGERMINRSFEPVSGSSCTARTSIWLFPMHAPWEFRFLTRRQCRNGSIRTSVMAAAIRIIPRR
jgi:2-hydroxy-3-oxopropionate reductase